MAIRGASRSFRWFMTLLLVTGLVAGCGGEEGSEEAAGASETTAAVAAPVDLAGHDIWVGDGFSIAVPSGWTPFGPEDLDFGELFEAAEEEVDLGILEGQLAAVFEQGGLLMAFDFENARPEFVDNLNILRTVASPLTASGLNRISVEQYEQFGATNVESEVITVPAGEGALITYTLPQFGNDGFSLTVLGEEYDWTITISVRDAQAMAIDPDVIFDSFRILP